MDSLTSSLIMGFLIGSFCVWVVSLLNDRYIRKERHLSRLLLKRGKKG
jgi:hypothetical protein